MAFLVTVAGAVYDTGGEGLMTPVATWPYSALIGSTALCSKRVGDCAIGDLGADATRLRVTAPGLIALGGLICTEGLEEACGEKETPVDPTSIASRTFVADSKLPKAEANADWAWGASISLRLPRLTSAARSVCSTQFS